jgi:hypothetical protein
MGETNMEKIKEYLAQNKISATFFLILTTITSIMTYFLVYIQSQIGVYYWDIFFYLNNALKMAGMGVGDTLYLSPFLPLVTSLFFRAGLVQESTLFAISGVFYLLGTLGLYLLLNLRFKPWESLAGALSFATFTVVIIWAASGALDVPAISISIWALYLTLLAVKKDSRFYYIAFPVAMLAFLTRFTSGLILLPMLLVIFMKLCENDFKKTSIEGNVIQKIKVLILGNDFKNMVIGLIIGILTYLPFMWYFNRQVGNLFPFLDQFSGSASGAVSASNPGFSLDTLYYLKHIPEYISSWAVTSYQKLLWPSESNATILAYVLLGVIIVGIIIYLAKIISKMIKNDKPRLFHLKLSITIIMGLILVLTYSNISYALSEILLLFFSVSVYVLLKDLNLKYLDMDILFFTWFTAFLIMHSAHPVKVDRYFITMAPPLTYGIALGINQISSILKYQYKDINLTSALISAVLVISMILSASAYIGAIPTSDAQVQSEQATAAWLMDYDPDYDNKTIAADRGPAFSWYLKKYVFTRINFKTSSEILNDKKVEINQDYYIYVHSENPLNLEGYYVIKRIDGVIIYQKK